MSWSGRVKDAFYKIRTNPKKVLTKIAQFVIIKVAKDKSKGGGGDDVQD